MPDIEKLSITEATNIVKKIVRTATSDDQIRTELNTAGFNGDEAMINSAYVDGFGYMAQILVWGPGDKVIMV